MKRIHQGLQSLKTQLRQNLIAIASLFIALAGLTANISYMEHKELNSNLRTASFQLLIELSELEKITFQLQFDKETGTINARTGWVKVRLIEGLSKLTSIKVQKDSDVLLESWKDNWQDLGNHPTSAFDDISNQISAVRQSLIELISTLN
ncbi:MAG TPA: hypothetical protein ENJ60_08825 [Aeromonadales bacterium]|nr:hypothetical protein [Aeromonadales bacterium]